MKILRQFFILTLFASCLVFAGVQNLSAQETQLAKNVAKVKMFQQPKMKNQFRTKIKNLKARPKFQIHCRIIEMF